MRVNVYAEEITDRVELVEKTADGRTFVGVRFYLELPATVSGVQHQGPFIHRPGDDDSAAVTFWGKQKLRAALRRAISLLNDHAEMPKHPTCPKCGCEMGPQTVPDDGSWWCPSLKCGHHMAADGSAIL